MTALRERKTRLTFETADEIRDRGRYRAVVVEAEPDYAVLRLKGTRHRFQVSWAGLYQYAAKCEVDRLRREKAASRKR
jgi:hypothetical protein